MKCIRGLDGNEEEQDVPRIALLFVIDKEHYNLIRREHNFQGLATAFKNKYFPDPDVEENIPVRKPKKVSKPQGKTKSEPEIYVKKLKNPKYTVFQLGNINGIQHWSYVKDNNSIDTFYMRNTINADLEDNLCYFTTYLSKTEETKSFNNWLTAIHKSGIKNKGSDHCIEIPPKNAEIKKKTGL